VASTESRGYVGVGGIGTRNRSISIYLVKERGGGARGRERMKVNTHHDYSSLDILKEMKSRSSNDLLQEKTPVTPILTHTLMERKRKRDFTGERDDRLSSLWSGVSLPSTPPPPPPPPPPSLSTQHVPPTPLRYAFVMGFDRE
jgi:hypothetical protein